ncbi:hypothetical protein RD792_006719, partial [Penstemon davidsonii]
YTRINMAIPKLVLASILLFVLQQVNSQGLKADFYKKTCPSLESVVHATTARYISRMPSLAAALLRMHFHDCFIRGCDGSVLISSTSNNTAEKDSIPNLSLRGFQVIDIVKSAVEKQCPGRVSCADILALVARDAVSLINGPSWSVPLGRRDGRVSNATEALLVIVPFSWYNIMLVRTGGGHTIGFSQCSTIRTRLYNFTGVGDSDPSMDPNYVSALKRKCSPTDKTSIIQMDPGSSQFFDVNYYATVEKRRGLFQSDAALLTNNETNAYVTKHSTSSATMSFFKDFATSMVKMGNIQVLTGSAGEIRRICSAIN